MTQRPKLFQVDGLLTQVERLADLRTNDLLRMFNDTLLTVSKEEDTAPGAIQPTRRTVDGPGIYHVSLRRRQVPHGWGDPDNHITTALREWSGGNEAPLTHVNEILMEKLGVKIEPITTVIPEIDKKREWLTNITITGTHARIEAAITNPGE